MLQHRICKTCSCSFQGGPRAYYCHSCREERKRVQGAEHKRRKRKGESRPLGSIDKCEKCTKDYIVQSGNQRFCPECQPIHAQEYDRVTGLTYYHVNKDNINPVRNERRRKGLRTCEWCGKEFETPTCKLTCSPECTRKLRNKKWNERYGKKKNISK